MIKRTLGLAAGKVVPDMSDGRHRYQEKMHHSSVNRAPREQQQFGELRRRSKPAVILKMKPVAGASGQPNVLHRPQPIEQCYPKRQRSNPQRVKQTRAMMQNYPFFFAREEPAKLKDAPEWYQKIGKRTEGMVEKNTHVILAGKSFPLQKQSVYAETSKSAMKRGVEAEELKKLNHSRISNNAMKSRVTKDTLQNLIYELKHRDDRFEQTSRVHNEKGLGYAETTVRGNSLTQGRRNNNSKASMTLPAGQPNASQDTRFSLPTSVKNDYNDQLILFTELPLEMKKNLARNQQKARAPQKRFKSVFRQAAQDESLTREVNKKLIGSHNVKISEQLMNKAQDEVDHYPMVNVRIKTQFEPSKQGKVAPYSELMKSFQAADLRYKHKESPNKKRFGVLEQDAGAATTKQFLSERDAYRSGTDVSVLKRQTSDSGVGQGLVKPDLRDTSNDKTYGNTKNYSNLTNNYSYKVQLQRQINKVRKHQPNASLSKLIDLSDFRADHKLSKDMIMKNIAENFKQHRANLRQGVVGTAEIGGSRTPHANRTNANHQLMPAGQSPLKNLNNSVSPSPRAAAGSLNAQKEWIGQASQEWQMNTAGINSEWKLAMLNSSINSRTSPNVKMQHHDWDRLSQSSHQSLGQFSRATIQNSPKNINLHKGSVSQGKSLNQQDPTSSNPLANPFKMSDRNKQRDKACSILFKAPRGPDRSPSQHYQSAHKNIESRARSSTEQHLLPAVQKHTLSAERDFNQVRNQKVSVGAINGDSRPLKFQDFKLKDPEPFSLTVLGKKMGSKTYRNGEVFRDSIQNMHQERIAAQVAQTQMHLKHQKLNGMPQFQTLQVFQEKRPACFNSPEERNRSSTIYNKTIAMAKDLSVMKVTAAGVNRDTQIKTPHELRQGLLETNFQVSFQKELDQYKTNNVKLFPRYKLSAALLDDKKAEKQSYKDKDLKTHWNLMQVSQLSQRETPMKAPERNEADKKLLQQYQERQQKNEVARRESVSSRITMGNNRELARLSPAPLISHTPQQDQMRSGIVLAARDLQVKSRFAPQRNESSRMSMSLHSEKSKWYPREATSPLSTVMRQQSNLNFSLSRRENSYHGNFPTMQTASNTKQDLYETRSFASRHSSFQHF